MGICSKIANRTVTSLSIDKEKLKLAKQKGINIGLLLDEALTRALNPKSQEAYQQAIEKQNSFLRCYVEDRGLQQDLDKYKYGDEEDSNVLEEKERPARKDREDKGSVRGIWEEV